MHACNKNQRERAMSLRERGGGCTGDWREVEVVEKSCKYNFKK